MPSFINENLIDATLKKTKSAGRKDVESALNQALKLKGLSLEETAILLQINDSPTLNKLFKAARAVKEKIYGRRLVLFAPLYITNYCVNDCRYCGFRSSNKKLKRRRLSINEIVEEVKVLENEGHKRLLLVAGEDPLASKTAFLEKVIAEIYKTKAGRGEIRRLNVNVAPMSAGDFKRLKATGIGTYQLFQETYHPATYRVMHPRGPKSDYEFRLYAMHRAMTAGISDVGLGVLFGLHDYKFEVLALLQHAQELEKKFGAGPHTISVPRLEPALESPIANHPPHLVSDTDFKKLVAVLRLAVPYTGLILSTRETAKLRNEVFGLGISQISAGSSTTPGGYGKQKAERLRRAQSSRRTQEAEQFSLHDRRSLLEVIKDISRLGYSPSFCTACYRLGRVGKDFMDLAKPGLIGKFCLPNSLLTFKEYLLDYGDDEVLALGGKNIYNYAREIKNSAVRGKLKQKLEKLNRGERDLYF